MYVAINMYYINNYTRRIAGHLALARGALPDERRADLDTHYLVYYVVVQSYDI